MKKSTILYLIILGTGIFSATYGATKKDTSMNHSEIHKDQINVIGIKVDVPNPEQAQSILGKTWEKFLNENLLAQIPNTLNPWESLAVYTNYESNESGSYSVIIGAEVSSLESIPEGFTSIAIPAQNYTLFKNQGMLPDAVRDTWKTIWATPLERVYTYDIEVYKGFTEDGQAKMEIYIAIK